MYHDRMNRDYAAFLLKIESQDRYERKDGEPTMVEIKKAIEDTAKAFEEFKRKNDQELAEIKKKGSADVVTSDEVKRINDQLSELTKKMQEIRAAANRPALGGTGGGETDEMKLKHKAAFEAYFRRGESEAELKALEEKAFNSQSNPNGGYLVPTEMSQTIDRVLGTVSVMRRLASVVSIGTSTYTKLVNLGGTGSGWVGETQDRPATAMPKLSQLTFSSKELYASPVATQEMLDDAMLNLEQWLANEVNIEFAEQEGAAFIVGNGINEPRGLLQYPRVANGSYAWGSLGYVVTGASGAFKAAGSDPADCLIDLVHALKSGYRMGATFLMNDMTCAAVRKIKDSEDNYLWRPGITSDKPDTLLGYPVEYDDHMQDLASDSYSIAFGNFKRAYLIVDRMGVRLLRDPFSNKPYVSFYTTKRVGGGIQNFEAVKLLKFGTS